MRIGPVEVLVTVGLVTLIGIGAIPIFLACVIAPMLIEVEQDRAMGIRPFDRPFAAGTGRTYFLDDGETVTLPH
jgi:hypothetical protein